MMGVRGGREGGRNRDLNLNRDLPGVLEQKEKEKKEGEKIEKIDAHLFTSTFFFNLRQKCLIEVLGWLARFLSSSFFRGGEKVLN